MSAVLLSHGKWNVLFILLAIYSVSHLEAPKRYRMFSVCHCLLTLQCNKLVWQYCNSIKQLEPQAVSVSWRYWGCWSFPPSQAGHLTFPEMQFCSLTWLCLGYTPQRTPLSQGPSFNKRVLDEFHTGLYKGQILNSRVMVTKRWYMKYIFWGSFYL